MAESKYKAVLDPEEVLRHYEQPFVQEAILAVSHGKEVVGSFGGTGYAKRPDLLLYPMDIIEQVKRGVTSFHFSEETWHNPMMLTPGMPEAELNALRKGWDLIIDIDCAIFEYSRLAAHLLIQALQHHGINAVSCKFSGNHGFHIGVPFEAFPLVINGKPIEELFPEAARIVAEYLKEVIEPAAGGEHSLSNAILRFEQQAHDLPIDAPADLILPFIQEKTGQPFEKLTLVRQTAQGGSLSFNALSILELDTILISSRHLLRHVYSINEKSGLVSIPINPEKVLSFEREIARLQNHVQSRFVFLDRNVEAGQATKLFLQAYDFKNSSKIDTTPDKEVRKRVFEAVETKVPEQYFPPCIHNIMAGIKDGKKRSMFIIVNFLQSVGWDVPDIDAFLTAWNQKNPEPLREIYIRGQINALKKGKPVLPPNCDHAAYYKGIGICTPDKMCATIKNPVNYALKKVFIARQREEKPKEEQKAKRIKLTEEEKAARRTFRAKKKAEKSEQGTTKKE